MQSTIESVLSAPDVAGRVLSFLDVGDLRGLRLTCSTAASAIASCDFIDGLTLQCNKRMSLALWRKCFPNAARLTLTDNGSLGDDDLAVVSGIVTSLSLKRGYLLTGQRTKRLSDAGFAHLRGLQSLSVHESGLTSNHVQDEKVRLTQASLAVFGPSVRRLHLEGSIKLWGDLSAFPSLEELSLSELTVTSDALRQLPGLKKLVYRHEAPLAPDAYSCLGGLQSLTLYLRPGETPFSTSCFAHLRSIRELRVDVSYGLVVDYDAADLAHLGRAGLQRLGVRGVGFGLTGEALRPLGGSLTSLDLFDQPAITDADFELLPLLEELEAVDNAGTLTCTTLHKLPRLRKLTLRGFPLLTDDVLQRLGPRLTSLELQVCDQLTDAALMGMDRLTQLSLRYRAMDICGDIIARLPSLRTIRSELDLTRHPQLMAALVSARFGVQFLPDLGLQIWTHRGP